MGVHRRERAARAVVRHSDPLELERVSGIAGPGAVCRDVPRARHRVFRVQGMSVSVSVSWDCQDAALGVHSHTNRWSPGWHSPTWQERPCIVDNCDRRRKSSCAGGCQEKRCLGQGASLLPDSAPEHTSATNTLAVHPTDYIARRPSSCLCCAGGC